MKKLVILIIIAFAVPCWAVPQLINYQGYLTRTDGTPLDTTVAMSFRIFGMSNGGNMLWMETHPAVVVTDGLFQVLLGSVTPLSDLFDANRWLEIQVGSDFEMTPRQQIVSVAHAYRVGTVDGASGGTVSGKLNVGNSNLNPGAMAMVAGQNNRARGDFSVVSGGGGISAADSNSVTGWTSVIGGGKNNSVLGDLATISGGFHNSAGSVYSTVGGGSDNIASGFYGSTVAGGFLNEASGQGSTVSGGYYGYARGNWSVVAGGGGNSYADSNSAIGDYSTVGGGNRIWAGGAYSTVAGGHENAASFSHATVGGGWHNGANNYYATVAGGVSNTAIGDRAAVLGGSDNTAFGANSVVGGGGHNFASGAYSVVAGGGGPNWADSNQAWSSYATIGGGNQNLAGGAYSTVAGGASNRAQGDYSAIGGGRNNEASGMGGTVPGGQYCGANGNYSFAAGYRAKAIHANSFVWADGTANDYSSDGINSFNVRAFGGVKMYTSAGGGAQLPSGASAWIAISDSTKKTDVQPVDTKSVLDKVTQIPIQEWRYKEQMNPNIRHMGPMAQDFWKQFHLGEDSLGISTIDPDGVALAAIQELAKQNAKLETRNLKLEEELTTLRGQVQSLLAKDGQTQFKPEN
jgi:hypothetical protein